MEVPERENGDLEGIAFVSFETEECFTKCLLTFKKKAYVDACPYVSENLEILYSINPKQDIDAQPQSKEISYDIDNLSNHDNEDEFPEVRWFLEECKCVQYQKTFLDNEVFELSDILMLTKEDLKELGFKVGGANKVLKLVEMIKNGEVTTEFQPKQ